MGLVLIPAKLRNKFTFEEREHAVSILKTDFPKEWKDIMDCLDAFWLTRKKLTTPGGNRSQISIEIDSFLQNQRGWQKKRFDTKIVVDGVETPSPTTGC
jgi:hypothetical protein